MALTQFTEDMDIIAALDDRPNAIGGLEADELKAEFDKAGTKIKAYLNGTLLPELDSSAASSAAAIQDLQSNAVRYDVAQSKSTTQTRQARTNINAARMTMIGGEFSESATYGVGAFVIYNDGWYRCKEAVTVAGEWSGDTNWAGPYTLATSMRTFVNFSYNQGLSGTYQGIARGNIGAASTDALQTLSDAVDALRFLRVINADVPATGSQAITATVYPDEELRDGDAVLGKNGYIGVMQTPEGAEDPVVYATGLRLLDSVANDVTALKGMNKVVWCTESAPLTTHPATSESISASSFHPAPSNVGDVVIGSNGCIGTVTALNYSGSTLTTVTVSGAYGGLYYEKARLDLTALFIDSGRSDPVAFLKDYIEDSTSPTGRYLLSLDNGTIIYHADCVESDTLFICITEFGDDGIMTEQWYINGTLVLEKEINGAGASIDTGNLFLMQSPTLGQHAANKGYVDSEINAAKESVPGIYYAPYAGVDLTTKFSAEIAASPYSGDAWAWIKARIQAGNFNGIHVCDYIPFTVSNTTYNAQVAGIDTYKGYGDTAVGHHIDFISKELWTTRAFNPANYNNGVIPVETVTGDGTTTAFTLTKQMHAIDTVKQGNTALTGWTYDVSTYTLTFSEAPSAGAITVTGAGSEFPWLSMDMYFFLNSLAGHVANSATFNDAISHVDYTAGGVFYNLPSALKNVIVEKRAYLPRRYNNAKIVTDDTNAGWESAGKLWLPTEFEVYGSGVYNQNRYALAGSCVQYPIFVGNMNRAKALSGTRKFWWLMTASGVNVTGFCYVGTRGEAQQGSASTSTIGIPVCFRIA